MRRALALTLALASALPVPSLPRPITADPRAEPLSQAGGRAPLPHADAWLNIPRIGLDHSPLPKSVAAELLHQAGGHRHRVVIRLGGRAGRWLYILQTPRHHEKPRFLGDEIQIVLGPRSRYKPAQRWYVLRVSTVPQRALHRVLAHLSRSQRTPAGLVLVRCWGQCTIVVARHP